MNRIWIALFLSVISASSVRAHEGCFSFHDDLSASALANSRPAKIEPVRQEADGPEINFGMSGAFYNVGTSGQGMLLEVIPARQLINVAWFTHADVEAADATAQQRWFFGTGHYTDNGATIPLTLSRGGRFDAPPSPQPAEVGQLQLRFRDCHRAMANYTVRENAVRGLPNANEGALLEGSIELERIGDDHFCEQLADTARLGLVAVRDVRILPMDTDRVQEQQTVLVRGGIIEASGPSTSIVIPTGTVVIEGRGRWLMPGLIEGHAHEIPLPFWPQDTEGNLIMYLANGITSVVNMGDATGVPLDIAAFVRSGAMRGPTLYVGQFARGQNDGGNALNLVRTPDEARVLVRRAVGEKYDFIKSYSRISRGIFDALVDEGRLSGLPIVGHVSLDFPYLQGIQNGQRMVVHSSDVWAFGFGGSTTQTSAIPAQAEQLRQQKTAMGTTLAVLELIKDFGLEAQAGRDLFARVLAQEGTEYMDDRAITAWKRMLADRPDLQTPRDLRSALTFTQQIVSGFHQAGVVILPGSDTIGVPGMVPGFSLHRELELMEQAGMSRFAVLRSATRDHAAFITQHFRVPQQRFGVIEPGARADLLLLDTDPRLDLRALRQPAGVMANGRWYSGEWLRDQLKTLRNTRSTR